MEKEQLLKDKFGTRGGMTTPKGYFESLSVQVIDNLPEYPVAPKIVPLSRWQRIKPYAYLAAMFAGIWLMMQVYHDVLTRSTQVNMENPPAMISQAANDDDLYGMMMLPEGMADYAVETEVSNQYNNIAEFERDFGYQLKDEYDKMGRKTADS